MMYYRFANYDFGDWIPPSCACLPPFFSVLLSLVSRPASASSFAPPLASFASLAFRHSLPLEPSIRFSINRSSGLFNSNSSSSAFRRRVANRKGEKSSKGCQEEKQSHLSRFAEEFFPRLGSFYLVYQSLSKVFWHRSACYENQVSSPH